MARAPLIEHPTLRDLVVQHFGMNRSDCPDPYVQKAVAWDDWLALAGRMSDEELLEARKLAVRFKVILLVGGQAAQWHQAMQEKKFESRDLYRTPGATTEPKLSRLLTERRTEGELRRLMVAETAEDRAFIVARRDDPAYAKVRAYLDSRAGLDGNAPDRCETDPAVIDRLSDWRLSEAWMQASFEAAFYIAANPAPSRRRKKTVGEGEAGTTPGLRR